MMTCFAKGEVVLFLSIEFEIHQHALFKEQNKEYDAKIGSQITNRRVKK